MLETEAEASNPQTRLQTRISPDNYEFHMVRATLLGNRMAYVIDAVPKRREQRLFEGRIWIDAQDYALVRIEGAPSQSPSFWIRSIHFVHIYRNEGPFWFPASTESDTEVRIFGLTTVSINYFDYTPNPLNATATTVAAPKGVLTQ
jgi:outer membrane lipoprotein-sorting protein